ncbi:MAG: glutamate---cysteine ligase / carboxylate-amine ligase [Aliidongia sp.]|jgi:carboxylate-amine ligase|nr:glutamate---cysteine ligase / carboxylate-amine ligase [Aliidongia sp.]
MTAEPAFTLGIEEEYLLVDRASRELVLDPPAELLVECEKQLGKRVSPEFLRSQIEIQTGICGSAAQARAELVELRGTVAAVAAQFGMAPVAAASHPFASHTTQRRTDRERYNALHEDLQGVARRLVICGMHVHVGVEEPELKIDLMNQVSYFLPHLLALSTSSPFWQGEDTGLKSYRIAVFDEMPRTGIPERFESWGEYERHVGTLVKLGVIDDASKLWWDIRPSSRFPTLEMRIADVCTRVDDAIAIACLFRCLLRMLWRLRVANQRWRIYLRMLIDENRWRAQRYGIDEGLIDFGRAERVPYPQLLDEILALVREDGSHFGCLAELDHARTILARGTSAHHQRRIYQAALAEGREPKAALEAVVDWLIDATLEPEPPPV